MKDFTFNSVLKFLLWTAGLLILLYLFFLLSDLVIILAVSVLLAFIFNPFVSFIEKEGFSRLPSTLLVFTFFGLLIYLVFSLFIPKLVYQMNQVIESLHVYSLHDQLLKIEKDIYSYLPFFTPGELAAKVENFISEQIVNLFSSLTELLTSLVSVIALLVIVPFITFFLIKDSRILLKGIIQIMPNNYFEMSYWILKKVSISLGRFVRAWIFDAAFVGTFCGLGFYIIGIDNALPLGLIAGLGHLVPYLGPVIGGVPAILISLMQFGGFSHVPFIIILILLIYTIDNGFVQPYVFSKGVDMHPIIIILLIIAGEQLFGLLGMLLAVPTATVVKTAVKEIYFAYKNYNIARL